MEAVSREGGGAGRQAARRPSAQICGSAEAFQRGAARQRAIRPRLRPFDSKGRRLDVVEFHPAYHECMEISVKRGPALLGLGPSGKARAPSRCPGANVARSAGTYMAIQMEAGHQCPITMTNAAVPALLLQPELAKWWVPKILARELRQEPSSRRPPSAASPSAWA